MKAVPIEDELHKQVINALSKTPMFRALDASQLEQVVAASELLQFDENEAVARQGEASDSFFMLLKGEVSIVLARGGEATELGRMQPPETLGEVGVVLGEPRSASAIATADGLLALKFSADAFQKMYMQIPGFGMAATRGLAQRLQVLSDRIPLPSHESREGPAAEVIDLLPAGFIQRYRVLPLLSEGRVLTLGFVDEPEPQVLAAAAQLLPGMEIQPVRIDGQLYNDTLHNYAGVEAWRKPQEESTASAPTELNNPKLDQVIARMASEGASDLHLAAGHKPRWRLDGQMVEIADAGVIGAEDVLELMTPVLDERQLNEFQEHHDVDYGYTAPDIARVRANMYRDKHGVSAALRLLSNKIMSLEQLGVPPSLTKLAELGKGLVLVTGPTGSGKSTTLAAMVDHVNQNRPLHILTLEDPIEYIHPSKTSLVSQREVGSHTTGFSRALRAALREDPDVILVGEMRDLETVQLALEAANTGHLVFSTLHTSSAVLTVDRIVDMFPANQQNQVRTSLSESLRGVVSQALLKRRDGGRFAACEVLVVNHAVSNMIKEGKTNQIPNHMLTARKEGNFVLNDELHRLVNKNVVTKEDAMAAAVDRADFEKRLKRPKAPVARR